MKIGRPLLGTHELRKHVTSARSLANKTHNRLEKSVAKHAVFPCLPTMTVRTKGLQPCVLVTNTSLLNVVYLEVGQNTLTALALPLLQHRHALLLSSRQCALRGREVRIVVTHLLRHPRVEKNTATRSLDERLGLHTNEGYAGTSGVKTHAGKLVLVNITQRTYTNNIYMCPRMNDLHRRIRGHI